MAKPKTFFKDQIAEIQWQIDSGALTGAAAEDAKEEIGGIGLEAVLTELLGDEDDKDGGPQNQT